MTSPEIFLVVKYGIYAIKMVSAVCRFDRLLVVTNFSEGKRVSEMHEHTQREGEASRFLRVSRVVVYFGRSFVSRRNQGPRSLEIIGKLKMSYSSRPQFVTF